MRPSYPFDSKSSRYICDGAHGVGSDPHGGPHGDHLLGAKLMLSLSGVVSAIGDIATHHWMLGPLVISMRIRA